MKKIILALALLSTFHSPLSTLKAQQDSTYNESVLVRGSYRPVIEESEKLNFPAVITDTLGRIGHVFRYSIEPIRLRSLYAPARIKAARLIGEPATRLYNNYLRLGMGNYWSPLADLYWSSTRDTRKTYGLRLNHRSSWGTLPEYGKNYFGLTTATLFGKFLLNDRLQLSSDLSYQHDHNLYYGFTDDILQAVLGQTRDDISIDNYRAHYNLAALNIGIRNIQLETNKLGYSFNVHLSDLWASWNQNELNLNLSGDLHYGFNVGKRHRGVVYLCAEWDGYSYRYRPEGEMPLGFVPAPLTDTLRGNRNIVKLNPYVDFMLGTLQLHTGLTTAWDGFSDDSVTLHFFPDVTLSKKLFKDNLSLSLSATGGVTPNNWNTLRLVNPYIAPGSDQRATQHYDFGFHARWTISKKLEANAEVGYSLLDNDLVFMQDPDYNLQNVYKPFYLSDNRLTVGADIAFVNDEMLTLRLGGHYYNYKYTGLGVFGDDWVNLYRPDWDLLASADVNYEDKWLFHLEGQLLGKMAADGGETLPMRYGINAEVEYRHNRALSFFLKMDNLAFQRYYYWANYPSQRGLFILGLTYTIPHK